MWSMALSVVGKVAGFFGLSQLRVWFTIGAVVAATAFVASVYVKGRLAGQNQYEMAQLREQNAALERLYAATRKAEQEMAQEAQANDARVRELQEYVQQMENRDAECLSIDDVERLQNLIGR